MSSPGKQNPTATHSPKTKAERAERLAAELRSNLIKRKALSRSKAEAGRDGVSEPGLHKTEARESSDQETDG